MIRDRKLRLLSAVFLFVSGLCLCIILGPDAIGDSELSGATTFEARLGFAIGIVAVLGGSFFWRQAVKR